MQMLKSCRTRLIMTSPTTDIIADMGMFDWIYPKRCVGCGVVGRYVCRKCEETVEVCGESLRYKGVVRKLIKEIKYRGSFDMVDELVFLWERRVGDRKLIKGEWVVVAVPMWKEKRRERGFNQAELIARELAKKWSFEYRELLVRKRETLPMYSLKYAERAKNVQGGFGVVDLQFLTDYKRVILVDDVWTSGATMRECSRVLLQNGVKSVRMVVIAR